MLKLDGSVGEGGGQILRTALALSALTGQPFEIERIRAGRRKPGLMRQHLTAVRAAAEVCGARVDGDAPGSQSLRFAPGSVKPGDYSFAIGSAGSATLVLQTVLPPLLVAAGPSTITIEGGTHNPLAPPVDFLERSFLPLVRRLGPKVEVRLERWGFYPAGGGRIHVTIEPSARLRSFDLLAREPITETSARAVVANLSRSIAERELEVVGRAFDVQRALRVVEERSDTPGPGNILTLDLVMSHHTEVFSCVGEHGLPARTVGERVVAEARAYLEAGQPVGAHLADQLVIPFAMSGAGAFRTGPPTPHLLTNIDVVKAFLPVSIVCGEAGERAFEVAISSRP